MEKQKLVYSASDYTAQMYLAPAGISTEFTSTLELRSDIDLPFAQIGIAVAAKGEEPKSKFRADDGVPFSESVADKLINDPECKVFRQACIFKESQKEGVSYYLPLYNREALRFRPSVEQPISNAINVETHLTVEMRFAFDDGYTFSVLKRFHTGGEFSLSLVDIYKDCLELLEGDEKSFFEEVISNSPNAYYDEENKTFKITMSSESALTTDVEFAVESRADRVETMREFARSLALLRVVKFDEKIT